MKANLHILLCICLTTLVFAACSKDNPTGGDPSGAAVTGIVIDATTTNPVGNVDISTVPATVAVATDSTGNFSLGNVASGTYSLSAAKAGYATSTIAVAVVDGQNKQLVITLVPGGDNGDTLRAPFDPIPGNNASGQSTYLTLGWSSTGTTADSLRYDVYFGKNPAPEIAAENLTVSNLQRSGLELNTSYYWRVVVKDKHGRQKSSPVWSFKTTDLANNNPPAIPYEPTPVNGAASQPYALTLRWKCEDPDGDPLKYDVLLGTNPTPSEPVASDVSVNNFQVSNLQANTTYYWRVVAKDNHNGVTSSPVWSFSVKTNIAPNAPNTPTPVNGAIDQSLATTLRWNASDDDGDKLSYDIYLSTSNPPTDIIAADNATNSFIPSGLLPNTTYYWRVVAKDNHGGVTSGPVWSFTTMSPPVPGLVAYYPFNGNANDETGNGHNGTVYNATLTSDRHGNANSAYTFGSGKYIEVPHSSALNFKLATGFTIGAWVKFTSTQDQYAGIVAKGPVGGEDPGYLFVISGNTKLSTAIGEDGYLVLTGTHSLNDGQWHYVTVVLAPSREIRLYVDGQLEIKGQVAATAQLDIVNTRPLYIGTERNKTQYFKGSIDDVRLYNYVLTDAEIQNLAGQ